MGKKFDEYYQFYLSKHQKPLNKFCHLLGNLATVSFVVVVVMFELSLWWLLLTPFVVYPIAVVGHLLFEGSMPAFFSSNPLYAKMADWRMMFEWLTRKIK